MPQVIGLADVHTCSSSRYRLVLDARLCGNLKTNRALLPDPVWVLLVGSAKLLSLFLAEQPIVLFSASFLFGLSTSSTDNQFVGFHQVESP